MNSNISNNEEQKSESNHNSDLIYAVYKKNWYNDEPADNYLV